MFVLSVTSLFLAGHSLASVIPAPHAKLLNGDVLKGVACPGAHVNAFHGKPFAQPPVGPLRFLPPQPLNDTICRNGGIFDATRAAAPCPQFSVLFEDEKPMPSEDCLTLDVYVPAGHTGTADLPVKVWSYGGFNVAGGTSYPLYDGCNLATDSVVVAFNYRLGPLGFLGLESAGVQGNMAIQDYLAALEWVQENIASFGGNKSQVLLFGQSSGGKSDFVISTLPESITLISAAMMMSGGGQFYTPYKVAQEVGKSFAETLSCSSKSLSCLQSRSVEELRTAYSNVPAVVNSTYPLNKLSTLYGVKVPKVRTLDTVIVDGKIVPEEPLKRGSRVPVIVGAAQNDAALLIIPTFTHSEYAVTEQNYTDFIDAWGFTFGPQIRERYPLIAFNHTGSTADAVISAITYIVTVSEYICPSERALSAAEAAGTDAFGYRFNHTPSCPWLREAGVGPAPTPQDLPIFGPTHTSDIPYVFGNLENMPFGNGHCNSTADEYLISSQLRNAMTAMAIQGNPSTSSLEWPRYNSKEMNGVLIDDKLHTAKLDFDECAWWTKVWIELSGESVPGIL